MTPHISAEKGDFAKVVLMPGDPLRAKYIADNFLTDVRLITSVRNILGYTGFYKGKRVSVMASGMGIPSMGIYCYELYKFYDVDTIIRIGSCGTFLPEVELFETILVDKSYTESNFALSFNNSNCHIIEATQSTNNIIENTAKNQNICYTKCNALCNECFDPYTPDSKILERVPSDIKLGAAEMESFALFYIAKMLNKNASCLLTVVDSPFKSTQATAEERQNSLNEMITLALESSLEL